MNILFKFINCSSLNNLTCRKKYIDSNKTIKCCESKRGMERSRDVVRKPYNGGDFGTGKGIL